MLRALALLVLLVNLALLLWGSGRPPPAHMREEPPPLPDGLASLLLLEESEHRIPRPLPVPSGETATSCLRLDVAEDRSTAEALAAEVTARGHAVDWLDVGDTRLVFEARPGPAGHEAWSEPDLVALARELGLEWAVCLEVPAETPIAPPTTIP